LKKNKNKSEGKERPLTQTSSAEASLTILVGMSKTLLW